MTFKALRVIESNQSFNIEIAHLNLSDLPQHEVLIRVHYSSLNYKDGLSARGHRGITRHFPHTPGIDAAGIVEKSRSEKFKPGDSVLVTGYDLGMNTSGGFSEYIQVPSDWIVPLPENLTLYESMIYGTAGFTAALAMFKFEKNEQFADQGPILVTGASGGVGSLAVALLSKNGYSVIASTGKEQAIPYLKSLGASECIDRHSVVDLSGKLLLKPRWAGAVDTVGGKTLDTVLKACQPWGNVAVCGLVDSPDLNTTVYPFILNGINVLGINSSDTPMNTRLKIWQKLANEWKLENLERMATDCQLEKLPGYIDKIMAGQITGRTIVKCI